MSITQLNKNFKTIKTGSVMKYKLGKKPSMTVEHNIVSWNKVERRLLEHGVAEFELLVS